MRDERGDAAVGCVGFLAMMAVIFVIAAGCAIFTDGGTSDCYHTPGAKVGSAQHDRDVQRCLNQ